MKTNIFIFIVLLFQLFISCESWVEIGPPENQLTTDQVFSDSTTINGAVADIYSRLERNVDAVYNKHLGIYTDELTITSTSQELIEFATGQLSPNNVTILNIWSRFYFSIYQANDIIEQIEALNSNSEGFFVRTLAEAKFIRAFCYYHLFNCFGDIPLILSTDVNESSTASRSDSTTVFNQILADLKSAETAFLSYDNHTKTRGNSWAVKALLSRVLLHQEYWEEAEIESSEIINSGIFTPLESLTNVFSSGSREAIFQLWTQNGFIADAPSLIPSSGTPLYPVSDYLMDAFESGDNRITEWINTTEVNGISYSYPFKYRNRTANTSSPEYLNVFRISEQLLIRAEARAHQGKTGLAIEDLNLIRVRAGLNSLPNDISQLDCLEAIAKERRVELFLEWGQRFIDLKRKGILYSVMSEIKSNWPPHSVNFPIPQNEIIYNKNLSQNPGY